MRYFRRNTFYCFSAPVMYATFIIELSLAIYILLSRKINNSIKLIVLILVHLAIFQLTEYSICESWGMSASAWAKIGFIVITFLPVYGLHLVHTISKQKMTAIIPVAYIVAFIWSVVLLSGSIPQNAVCSGNYIIYKIPDPYEGLYYLYYNITLALAVAFAYVYSTKLKSKQTITALRFLIIAYMSFIIPSIIFNIVDSYVGLDSPLPSVMCGFAVLLALILTFVVAPNSSDKKNLKE